MNLQLPRDHPTEPPPPPLSLFKKMQLKYAKMPMEKGRENLKKMEKRKGVFL